MSPRESLTLDAVLGKLLEALILQYRSGGWGRN